MPAALPVPTLRIRPIDPPPDMRGRTWLFLDYGGGDWALLDFRWAIHCLELPDGTPWWGVVVFTPDGATHESALDGVATEMALAKEAIGILKRAEAH